MIRKKKTSSFCFFLWILIFLWPLPNLAQAVESMGQSSFRVLLVGDSWSEFFWINRSLRNVFAAQDHSEILEKGDATTISGSTAAEWTDPARLQLIADELSANPSIDIIQLTIGGNDFLAGMPGDGWYVGLTAQEEETLILRILGDIQTVIDYILALGPQYRILLSFYDYPNFEDSLSGILAFSCVDLYNNLNQPTTMALNQAFQILNARLVTSANNAPRVSQVDHTGLIQYFFGFPGQNIPPFTIALPGNLSLPNPIEAMFLGADCIHLSGDGYRVIAENLWRGFYQNQFCVTQITLFSQWPIWPTSQNVLGLADFVNRSCP